MPVGNFIPSSTVGGLPREQVVPEAGVLNGLFKCFDLLTLHWIACKIAEWIWKQILDENLHNVLCREWLSLQLLAPRLNWLLRFAFLFFPFGLKMYQQLNHRRLGEPTTLRHVAQETQRLFRQTVVHVLFHYEQIVLRRRY